MSARVQSAIRKAAVETLEKFGIGPGAWDMAVGVGEDDRARRQIDGGHRPTGALGVDTLAERHRRGHRRTALGP